jgi:protein-disulfide isomerase
LFRIRLILICSLAALATFGCRAQAPPPNASVERRIEVLVRSQFNVPSDYDVSLGGKTKSDIPGYDNLPVTFSHKGKQTTVTFLISKDGNTLARLEKFDISKDPQSIYSLDHRPTRGNPDAKITVVNYDDLECPYCARMHEELFPTTLDHYKGLVRYVYKDFPLVEIHPWAMHASIDANCLADQNNDAYWQFVDYAHSHGHEIDANRNDPKQSFTVLDEQARAIGKKATLNQTKLDACIAKQDESAVRASMREGEKLGIDGTPQLFVDGERVPAGAQPTSLVWDSIDRALKADGITPPERTDAAPATPATQAPAPSQ